MSGEPVSDESRVLAAATQLAGDRERALRWYEQEKLQLFGGSTAAQLVAQGRAEDLIRYIESLEAGPAG